MLSGLVIQNIDAVLSEGSRTSLAVWPFGPRSARRSGRAEVGRNAGFAVGMALGQHRQVVDELVARLHGVFHEVAVAHGVVGHVVLDPQVVGAVHRHAAAVGVVDRGVLDVLALAVAHDVPVDRIPGQVHVLAHAGQFDAGDVHLGPGHRHDVPAEVGLLRVVRRLDADVPRQQADFAALVDAVGDLAEVHVLQRLIERDRVAVDGGDGPPLRLGGIEVGRGQDDHIAFAPAAGVQDFDLGAAGLGRRRELGPGVLAVTVQAQGAVQRA